MRWRTQGIPVDRFPAVIALADKNGLRGVTYEALYAGRALTLKRAPTEQRRGRTTPDWHSKAAKLRANGLTAEQIGRAFQVNPRSVQRVLRKAQS